MIRVRCQLYPEMFRWTKVRRVLLMAALCAPAVSADEVVRADLPRLRVATDVTSAGAIIQVGAGGDFQAALQRAAPGDTIELAAGAIFRGPFVLPRKPGQQWITIRSGEAEAGLPAGVRVTPAQAAVMARLETASGAVVTAAPGAHHYRFIGIEFSPASVAEPVFIEALVRLNPDSGSAEHVPHHFIFERCYLHGDPQIGARRGIAMNSATTAVVDSYLADFKMAGGDSQAIIGWTGPGPYLLANNYLEAAGENLMFGGGDPEISGLVPADIEIRGNHFAKPLAWKAGEPGYRGRGWTVKNLFELKNARRVLVTGNLFEYNWPQAQNGYAVLFTVRNQDGSAPWSVVEDVTFVNNIVRHVANGINILGQDDNHPSQQTRRIVIRNNLFEDLGGSWGEGDLLQLLDGTGNVVIEHNTVLNSGKILSGEGRPHLGFVFRGNIVRHNQYGIVGTDSAPGTPVLERYFNGAVMRDNLIVEGPPDLYPGGNAFPLSIKAVGFVDAGGGDFRLRPQSRYQGAGVNFAELCAALSASERPYYCSAPTSPVKSGRQIEPPR